MITSCHDDVTTIGLTGLAYRLEANTRATSVAATSDRQHPMTGTEVNISGAGVTMETTVVGMIDVSWKSMENDHSRRNKQENAKHQRGLRTAEQVSFY